MTRRPILVLGMALAVLVTACGETSEPDMTTTSTTVTTTSTTDTTTSTTSTTIPIPADVDSIAVFPDQARLQDGTWAAIVFRQALECITEQTDLLAGVPVPCETPVLFLGEDRDTLVGTDVPVWLIRWPVISYAGSNGLTAMGQIRQLPTLIETTAEIYIEDDEAISLSGSILDIGPYEIETADGESRFAVPFETGPEVPLAELTGEWETGGHLLRVDDGGSYELFETRDGGEEATGVFGYFALQDGLLVVVTSAEPGPCSGDTGVYLAEKTGPGLHLAAVDEPCGFRAEAFDGVWSLSSAG